MKIKPNVFWTVHENSGYLKVGERIVKLNGITIDLQREYWALVSEHSLEELKDKIVKEEEFGKYIAFLKMVGALYDEKNIWSLYEKEQGVNFKGLNELLDRLTIQISGDKDLAESAANILQKDYNITLDEDAESEMAIVIARKENRALLNNLNSHYMSRSIPFLLIIVTPFNSFIGPFVFPGETPCFNCILEREKDSLFYDNNEEMIFNKIDFESKEPIPSFNITATAAYAGTQIMKYLFRKLRNQTSFIISNQVLEFQWMTDSITYHSVIRHLKCETCFPSEKREKSDIWLKR